MPRSSATCVNGRSLSSASRTPRSSNSSGYFLGLDMTAENLLSPGQHPGSEVPRNAVRLTKASGAATSPHNSQHRHNAAHTRQNPHSRQPRPRAHTRLDTPRNRMQHRVADEREVRPTVVVERDELA